MRAEQIGEAPERALAAEMADDLLERLDRQPGGRRGGAGGIARLRVRRPERRDRRLDLLRRQPHLRGQVGDIHIAGDLAEQTIEQVHHASPASDRRLG